MRVLLSSVRPRPRHCRLWSQWSTVTSIEPQFEQSARLVQFAARFTTMMIRVSSAVLHLTTGQQLPGDSPPLHLSHRFYNWSVQSVWHCRFQWYGGQSRISSHPTTSLQSHCCLAHLLILLCSEEKAKDNNCIVGRNVELLEKKTRNK